MWVCQEASSNSFFWEIFIFGYLLMLQIIGMVLAFQTRRVKLRGLRDSKEIAAIIYISSIAIVVMSIENFTLTNYINIGIGIFMLSIFVLTTIFLFLIFFPKVRKYHSLKLVLDEILLCLSLSPAMSLHKCPWL